MRSAIEPVLVVGMNGSGTTMLIDCLGRHPELYGFPHETKLMPYVLRKYERYGNDLNEHQAERLWHDVTRFPGFLSRNGGKPLPVPENWRDIPQAPSAVINECFLAFARASNKTRWCEKTPQHAQHLELLGRHFPKAKFVHIIRDGRDCAASFHRRWRRKPELTMYRWHRLVEEARRQSRSVKGRYLEVRYEDLTEHPEIWMRKIASFLDVEFSQAMLESRFPQSSRVGELGGLVPNSGNWRSYFDAPKIRSLERMGGTTLRSLNYPLTTGAEPSKPHPLQLAVWRAWDYHCEFRHLSTLKLQRKRRLTWKALLRRPFTAAKQRLVNRF